MTGYQGTLLVSSGGGGSCSLDTSVSFDLVLMLILSMRQAHAAWRQAIAGMYVHERLVYAMERRLQLPNIIDRLPGVSEIALVVLLAWMVAGWLLPVSGASVRTIRSVGSGHITATMAQPDIDAIASVPLFGLVAKGNAGATAPVAPSRLDIKLMGTVVAGKRSAAIVAIPSDPHQKVVAVGGNILPGVTLAQVMPKAIMIRHDGRLERIYLIKAIPSLALVGEVDASVATRKEIPRAELSKQLQDFPKLLSQARVIPRFKQGRSSGYLITNIVPGSLYDKAGLKNGDIIQRVDGKAVRTPKQAMAMYQSLQNASSIDLAIIRRGQPQQIHYDIR